MNALTVPATLDSLADITALVLKAAEAAGIGKQATYRLRLAVDEIATNIANYAYAGSAAGAQGTIDVRAEISNEALRVTLEDTGMPFDPRQVPRPQGMHLPPEERDIGGLGVFLAREGVDEFHYERVGDRNRNVFVVHRPRKD